MIKYTKVYRNQSTVIPIEIDRIHKIRKSDIIKWTLNKYNKKITISIHSKNTINPILNNKIIKTDYYTEIYRTVSNRRHIILPVEVEEYLKFDKNIHILKWNINDNDIVIEKELQANILNISGILKKDDDTYE